MQILILAAGESSRFHPFNSHSHKSATSLLGKPIIIWTLESLIPIGPDEVIIVIGPQDQYLEEIIKSHSFPFKIRLVVQKEAKGQANGILSAFEYLAPQFIVIDAHHINSDKTIREVLDQLKDKTKVHLSIRSTDKPWLYGIVQSKDQIATNLVEKPKESIANPQRIVGVYYLTLDFLKYLKNLESQNPQDQYLLESGLNSYLKTETVYVSSINTPTLSLRYPWDLFDFKDYITQNYFQPFISPDARISPQAQIDRNVIIEAGAQIMDYASIKEFSYIGKNVIIGNNALIRNSVLEAEVHLGYNSEVTRSLIMAGTHSHGHGFIGDSIIAKDCRIGSGFTTANRRLDHQDISCLVKGISTPTGRSSLGTFIGDHVHIGILAGTMPNVIISSNSQVLPGSIVSRNI